MDRGFFDSGGSAAPIHGVDFDGDDLVSTGAFSLSGEIGFVASQWLYWTAAGGVAVKAGTNNPFEATIISGPQYQASLQTSGGTYTVSASTSSSTKEDWTVVWSGSRDTLTLYKDGVEVAETATTGDLTTDDSGEWTLGTNTNGNLTGKIALPTLLVDDLDEYDVWRYLAWRNHVTGLGPSVSVP